MGDKGIHKQGWKTTEKKYGEIRGEGPPTYPVPSEPFGESTLPPSCYNERVRAFYSRVRAIILGSRTTSSSSNIVKMPIWQAG